MSYAITLKQQGLRKAGFSILLVALAIAPVNAHLQITHAGSNYPLCQCPLASEAQICSVIRYAGGNLMLITWADD